MDRQFDGFRGNLGDGFEFGQADLGHRRENQVGVGQSHRLHSIEQAGELFNSLCRFGDIGKRSPTGIGNGFEDILIPMVAKSQTVEGDVILGGELGQLQTAGVISVFVFPICEQKRLGNGVLFGLGEFFDSQFHPFIDRRSATGFETFDGGFNPFGIFDELIGD